MVLLHMDRPRVIRPECVLGLPMLPYWEEFQELGDLIPHFYFEKAWLGAYAPYR